MAHNDIQKYLPLTESTFFILIALVEPLHGYAVMQKVETLSDGIVKLGPGTLYGAFTTLEKEGLISKVKEDQRRKTYLLTEKGHLVLAHNIHRIAAMYRNGQDYLENRNLQ